MALARPAKADPLEAVSASQLLRQVESGEIDHDIEIHHIQGRTFPPALTEVILRLRAKGHVVRGTLLTPEKFEESRERFFREGGMGESGRRFLVSSGDESASDSTIFKRISGFKNRLFGTPEGITFLRFLKRPFRPTRGQVGATIEALAIANPILFYALNQMQQDPQGRSIRMAAPLITLSAWIVTYIFNINQIAGFKGQGGTIEMVPTAPAGSQIQVKSNKPLIFVTSFVQEVLLNSLLMASMFPTSDLNGELLLNAFANAPLATFAKTPFEAKISDLVNEAEEARKQGDIARADSLSRKAILVERVASNYLFPSLKLLHLVAPALVANSHSAVQVLVANVSWVGLVITGVTGMAIEVYRNWTTFKNAGLRILGRKEEATACETLLTEILIPLPRSRDVEASLHGMLSDFIERNTKILSGNADQCA